MADVLKRTSALMTTSPVNILTAAAGETITLIGCLVANIDGAGPVTGSVRVTDGVGTWHLIKDVEVPAKASLELITGKVVLQSGDSLQVQAAAVNDLDVTVSYLSQT